MTRKMLTASMIVAALLLSVLSLGGLTTDAEAQGRQICSYEVVISNSDYCAKQLAYPGPFTNMPTTPSGPYGWGSLTPVAGTTTPGTTPPVTTPGAGGGLAHTGSESAVLGYVGTGLIAFGAVALGSRRKFFQGTLD